MSLRPSESTAWLEAIDAFISGEMNEHEAHEFKERLRHDDRARLVYVEYLDLHFELLQNAGRVAAHHPAGTVNSRSHWPLWFSVASVAAALAICAAILLSPRPEPVVAKNPPPNVVVPAAVVEPLQVERPVVARVGMAFDVRWTDSALSLQAGSLLRVGDVLDLYQGMVEVTFESGARCYLAADEGVTAYLRVDSAAGCTMESGRATFDVPPSGKGFTVTTAGGKFVDLGTEFGVQADPRGLSEVHVLAGEVEAHGSDRSRLLLHRGAAAQLLGSDSSPLVIEFKPDAFSRPAALLRGIDAYSGGVRLHVVPPSSLRSASTMTDNEIHLVMEQRGVHLESDWTSETRNVQESTATGIQRVPGFFCPAGRRVDAYLIHATPTPGKARRELRGQITFRRPILAVISTDADLRASRPLFGDASVEYPTEVGIGLEDKAGTRSDDRPDEVLLSNDRRTLTFLLNVGPVFDQFRVLVASDEGAESAVDSRKAP